MLNSSHAIKLKKNENRRNARDLSKYLKKMVQEKYNVTGQFFAGSLLEFVANTLDLT